MAAQHAQERFSHRLSRSLVHALSVMAAIAGFATAMPAHARSPAFTQAVQQYRAGHLSDAFGRFFALANDGDADAARIALFMHQYGPILYGRYWDAAPQEVAHWQALQGKPVVHSAPPFQPQWLDGGSFQPQPAPRRAVRKTTTP